jgi:hypothetical protein
MSSVTVKSPFQDDVILVQLTREIAMDISDLESILKRYEIPQERFEAIQQNPRFIHLMQEAVTAWHSALNTEQRVKFKSASMLEMWLEEAHTRLHDKSESLAAKTELAKFIGRLAGMGLTGAGFSGESGEKFSITINLGADAKLQFEKKLPAKVIEHEPTQTQEP